ncbi:molybdopterin-dependent oxidoreductase [Fibrella forsythiae]|uniref:Molybdopterin-dependent oxidoreductase n=1 Tax=Fibrella forsythiae TaxID=2817061 RepID=A0ABS3JEU9_9BACT|nr:molybdopterin-dependent oxidoreductase [Fibrella forsythiae]MBO0948530.1 molybdopterin-dependent oxidoreductase [Fibrella forsythiae]
METNEQEPHMPEREELTTDQQIRRRTIKSFAWFGLASLVPVGFWKYVSSQPKEGSIPAPLRAILNSNEQVANMYFSNQHLAPTFALDEAAKNVRINGREGLRSPLDQATWQLQIQQPGRDNLTLSLDDVKTLPKFDLIFDFKCVEGWSQVQHWGGARLADLITHYKLGTRTGQPATGEADYFNYLGMETPDKGYYVGLDIASAMHPQALLAYEMNGEPLADLHGAPLRLIIPVKYGVKNLKRIGTMTFADERPRDFWAERGYDYHVGL